MDKTTAAVEILKLPADVAVDAQAAAAAHLLKIFESPTTEDGEVTMSVEAIPGILRAIAGWYDAPDQPPFAVQGVAATTACRELADLTEAHLRKHNP